jgi:hypothetical protein
MATNILALQTNPKLDLVLSALIKNNQLLDALKIPDIANNISQLLNNPQLSSVINSLATNPNLLNQVSQQIISESN